MKVTLCRSHSGRVAYLAASATKPPTTMEPYCHVHIDHMCCLSSCACPVALTNDIVTMSSAANKLTRIDADEVLEAQVVRYGVERGVLLL